MAADLATQLAALQAHGHIVFVSSGTHDPNEKTSLPEPRYTSARDIALPDLFPDRTVRLVDGGVYDNQGAAGLLEQECTVLLISDASGQTATTADPSRSPLGVLWRSDNVLQARLRQTQFADEKSRWRSRNHA